jgi:subtilase family serine protease
VVVSAGEHAIMKRIGLMGAVLCAGLAVAARAQAEPLLSAHVPEAVARHLAPLVGAPAPDQAMALAVSLPLRDEAGLDAFLRQAYDPASPSYRRYLSVAAFTGRFGPSRADYDAVVRFLAQSGLRVTAVAANRYLVDVQGSVADVERVFHVRLGLYRHPTEQRVFVAPDREPTLDLAVPVNHVTGLDSFDIPRPRALHAAIPRAGRATGSGPGGQFLGSDARAAYYGGTTLTGSGQSLGLMELAGYNLSDVQHYFAQVGQTLAVPVVGISTDGAALGCSGKCHDDSEQVLDIEYAISMAPGLSQVQVYVGLNALDVLNRMASDNTSKQLSTSWGWGTQFATDDPLFKEMAAQGQTFLTASGDDSSLKASQPWPEEDVNLTAVGGTDLVTSGAGGPWASETGWSDSAGGPSLIKKTPIASYQLPYVTAANQGSTTRRNVPDVAGDADTDNYICFNGKCSGGWGGTSFASPLWAGFIALVNQQAAAAGKPPVGFINPALYALGRQAVFHDVTVGKSGQFSCTPSFDLVTGLGSPAGQALITALAGG